MLSWVFYRWFLSVHLFLLESEKIGWLMRLEARKVFALNLWRLVSFRGERSVWIFLFQFWCISTPQKTGSFFNWSLPFFFHIIWWLSKRFFAHARFYSAQNRLWRWLLKLNLILLRAPFKGQGGSFKFLLPKMLQIYSSLLSLLNLIYDLIDTDLLLVFDREDDCSSNCL